MTSRQTEKEQRRAEREAAEAAAARSASRKGRLQLALGGLVALAAIAVAVLVFGSGGDDASGGEAGTPEAGVALPAQKETNLEAAAKAAKCELKTTASEGRDHTTDPAKWVYKTNPPTSGPHNPEWAQDGLYDPGNTPEIGFHVHTLEHGRIDIQYKPGTPKATRAKLEALGSEKLNFGAEGYHVLVFENNTKMKAAVAATAWTHSLTCAEMNDRVYDAVRAFRVAYTDKGPELIR